jgi:hypothetical protein
MRGVTPALVLRAAVEGEVVGRLCQQSRGVREFQLRGLDLGLLPFACQLVQQRFVPRLLGLHRLPDLGREIRVGQQPVPLG